MLDTAGSSEGSVVGDTWLIIVNWIKSADIQYTPLEIVLSIILFTAFGYLLQNVALFLKPYASVLLSTRASHRRFDQQAATRGTVN